MPQKHKMPTVDVWKSQTRTFQPGTRSVKHAISGRGDNMKQVDNALALYWEMFNNYSVVSTRDIRILSALKAVVAACDTWITIKGPAPQGNLTMTRLTAVRALRSMAFAQLKMQLAKTRSATVNLNTTPLAAAYGKEAVSKGPAQADNTYRAAYSATSIVALKDTLDQGMLIHAEIQALAPVMAILNHHNLSTMTQAQFDAVGQQLEHVHGTSLNFQEPAEVVYLKRAGRAEFLIVPNNNRFEDTMGQPYDTGMINNRISTAMYAIDKYGSVFVRKAHGQMNGRNFNHSSLVGGKDVMCAGEIGIRNGALSYINNNSGHYQPNAALLQSALVWTYAQGIDITNTKVESTVPGQPNGPWKGMTFASQGSGAGSDWTQADDVTYNFA